MATEIRLNQSVTENPSYLVGGDFGAVIASTLTGANHVRAIVDGDLEVRGSVIGDVTGNLTGNVSGSAGSVSGYAKRASSAPASAVATGAVGDYFVDASYAYFCIETNTWVRVAVATW